MGRFRDEQKPNEINEWLLKQGYKIGRGAQGQQGFVKRYEKNPDESFSDIVWVTISVNEKKIYIYEETAYESYITDASINIEDDWLKDLDTFIEEVDNQLDCWI